MKRGLELALCGLLLGSLPVSLGLAAPGASQGTLAAMSGRPVAEPKGETGRVAQDRVVQAVSTAQPEAGAAEPLSLRQALKLAQERNISPKQSELEEELARLALERARLDRYGVSVDVSAGAVGEEAWALDPEADPVIQRAPFTASLSYGLSATASMPLYDGGATAATIGRKGVDLKQAEVQTALARRELAKAVYQAYWLVQGYDLQLEATREALAQSREAVTIIEARLKNGLAAPIELNRFRVDMLSQEQRLADLEVSAYTARQTLRRLLRLEGEPPALTDSARAASVEKTPEKADELLGKAHDGRLELQLLALAREGSRFDRVFVQSGYRPKVGLEVSASALGAPTLVEEVTTTGADFAPGVSLSGGVSLSWNLFNLWKTTNQMKQVEVALRQIELQRQAREDAIDEEVRAAHARLKGLQQREAGVKAQLELARDNLNIIQTLYGQGSATLLDLFDAQSSFRSALTQEASFRIDLVVASYDLRWSLGQELE